MLADLLRYAERVRICARRLSVAIQPDRARIGARGVTAP